MSAEQWMIYGKKADFNQIAAEFGISPITARIMRNRDVVGSEAVRRYLKGSLEDLYSPHLMKDMDLAVAILKEKIKAGSSIRVMGDYDIDGVCATYILVKGIERAGGHADYRIPDRILDGYGIHEGMVREAAEAGVDTLVTCDNGIAALEPIRLARELGLTVVVTDHHEVPYTETEGEQGTVRIQQLPPANAVVDPKRSDCAYPFPEVCGAVVAWKLVQALYEAMGIPVQESMELLEYAAIATVGDVMKLQDENRIIVKYGLQKLKNTSSPGLNQLILKNNLDPDRISAYHIGFVIGPCLNAGGRLQTARLALELLLCRDEAQAETMAAELKELNEQRKDMTMLGLEQAEEQLEATGRAVTDSVLVVYLDSHESLAGIVAGRLRESHNKPAIVLTDSDHEGVVKGSGRSIEAYSMFEKLNGAKEFLLKFGGHPMAAGLSLKKELIEPFRRRLNEEAGLTEADFVKKLWIDTAMPLQYVSEQLVQELSLLEPYGNGNEKPQFGERRLHIRSARVMGKNRNVVKLALVTEGGNAMDGIWFGDGDGFMEELGNRKQMDVIYYPDVNEYNGNRTLQIVIKNYRFSS